MDADPVRRWLAWSPVAAVLWLALGAAVVSASGRGCSLHVPIPAPGPTPVPEPAVPKEPKDIYPADAPEPPPAYDFSKESSRTEQAGWEWRDLPGWDAPTEGFGTWIDGEFAPKWFRRKGATTVYSMLTREKVQQ